MKRLQKYFNKHTQKTTHMCMFFVCMYVCVWVCVCVSMRVCAHLCASYISTSTEMIHALYYMHYNLYPNQNLHRHPLTSKSKHTENPQKATHPPRTNDFFCHVDGPVTAWTLLPTPQVNSPWWRIGSENIIHKSELPLADHIKLWNN